MTIFLQSLLAIFLKNQFPAIFGGHREFLILLCYNSPTYYDHVLNPRILDGWKDLYWL